MYSLPEEKNLNQWGWGDGSVNKSWKHKEQCSDNWNTGKIQPWKTGKAETRGSQGLLDSKTTNLVGSRFSERPCIQNNGSNWEQNPMYIAGFHSHHTHAHTCRCPHMHKSRPNLPLPKAHTHKRIRANEIAILYGGPYTAEQPRRVSRCWFVLQKDANWKAPVINKWKTPLESKNLPALQSPAHSQRKS